MEVVYFSIFNHILLPSSLSIALGAASKKIVAMNDFFNKEVLLKKIPLQLKLGLKDRDRKIE